MLHVINTNYIIACPHANTILYEIDRLRILYFHVEMSLMQLPLDIIRVIALRLDNIGDVHGLARVCRHTHHALSSDEFWRSRCERDFDIPSSVVKTICGRHQLHSRLYHQKYSRTHRIDKLIRSWIVKEAPSHSREALLPGMSQSLRSGAEDMGRFYSAFVRFFRYKCSYHTEPLTRQQRKHWRYQRRKGRSRPNDIWIYGPSNSGKTLFVKLMARVVDGFTTIQGSPYYKLCEETSNRLYTDYYRPNDYFVGEVFEFRNVFTNKYTMDPLADISRSDLKEYLFILETYGGEFYPTGT